MTDARPLRDVFGDLAGDGDAGHAAEALRAGGHGDLPDSLVAEAVVNFADTAPVAVAEHLSAYVMAHSPVPFDASGAPLDADPGDWLDLLATAPAPVVDDDPTGRVDDHAPQDGAAAGQHPTFDLDFGTGDIGQVDHAGTADWTLAEDGWTAEPGPRQDPMALDAADPTLGVDSGLFTVDDDEGGPDGEDADGDPTG